MGICIYTFDVSNNNRDLVISLRFSPNSYDLAAGLINGNIIILANKEYDLLNLKQ